jgi:hypothetical protein
MSVKKKPPKKLKVIKFPKPKRWVYNFGSTTAWAVGIPGENYLLITVPVVMTTVPEVPDAVRFEGHILLQTGTSPLTYTKISGLARAARR